MGFFKKFQLGKVLGSAAKGFASGGFTGAIAQGGAQAFVSGAAAASSRASSTGAVPSSFMQPSASFPMAVGGGGGFGGGQAITVARSTGGVPAVGVTQDIFNGLMKLADRLGIRIANPNAVIRVGRNLLAKLIRFSRVTPGLTIVSMLLNLGLTAIEANNLVTWYTTQGKRRRRIKVTNVKALNRSVRRLEGFTRLARRVEASIGRRAGVRSARRSVRCRKCRKNPCGC